MPEIFNSSYQAKKDTSVNKSKSDSKKTYKKRRSVDEYSEIMRQEKTKNNC